MLIETPRRGAESGEDSLAARAAWLYFAGGLTQGQIASRLGIANTKAHRLIARASRDGLIRIFVDAEVAACLELEDRLSARFGLDFCTVVPDLDEGPLPIKALGLGGAQLLKNVIERGETELVGIGHGRTLAAAVHAMPPIAANGMRFVSVLGGYTRRFAANPYDVIHRLAEKTGAEAYQIPLPTFANTVEDRAVLLSQDAVAEVFAMAISAPLVIAGVGDVTGQGFLSGAGLIGEGELAELKSAGAAGELLGHFFDAGGRPVAEDFGRRALSPDIEHLMRAKVVALAGGTDKVVPILSLLRSGILDGLVTDETTAQAIAAATEETGTSWETVPEVPG